jgi:hypothetical protein
MTSRRSSTLVLGLVLTLALAAGGPARAQWGYPAYSGPFGPGYGTGSYAGFSPYAYGSFGSYGIVSGAQSAPFGLGSFGGLGYGGFGGIGFSPLPGYAESTGQIPQTTTSFPSTYDIVTRAPRWSGSTRRVRPRLRGRDGIDSRLQKQDSRGM